MIRMSNIFKQFEAWATHLKADNFGWAVMRLTLYYTTGVFLILGVFSILIYTLVTTNLETNLLERQEEDISILEIKDEPVLHEVTENLLDILLVSDSIVLIFTLGVSYVLARKTLAPLKEAYQKQKKFVADAAHELRTPLAVLKAGSELLMQHERSTAEYKKFIEESHEEIERLISLSNDLLFLAQHTEQKEDVGERFSFSDMCMSLCESMRPYSLLKGVSLHTHIDEEVSFEGNKNDLSQLILNLLKNAIDYNKPEGSVTCSLTKDHAEVLLTIEDTGIGISEDDLPHIFDRFYKADVSRTQKLASTTGSGLGLSIVKEIVARLGGAIQVESVIGKGTIFTLRFPRA